MTLSMNILNAWIKSAIAACAPAGKQVPAPQKALGLSNHLKEDIGIGDASAVGLQSYLSDAKRVAGAALEQVASACRAQGVPFAGDTIERNLVWEGILETAKAEGCDLVVMGSHGRQGVKALILGSVAQKVLTHAQVPVLIVKG